MSVQDNLLQNIPHDTMTLPANNLLNIRTDDRESPHHAGRTQEPHKSSTASNLQCKV